LSPWQNWSKSEVMKIKYIIVKKGGMEVPVVFPEVLLHHEVAGKGQVMAAGFCTLNAGKWRVSGHSLSLNLGVRSQDAELLNRSFGP
jgi:hypothetical protein